VLVGYGPAALIVNKREKSHYVV